jgi:hypothetical protein
VPSVPHGCAHQGDGLAVPGTIHLPEGQVGGCERAAGSAGHARRHTPTSIIDSGSIGENACAVTVHMCQYCADLRRSGGLYASRPRVGTLPEVGCRKHCMRTGGDAAPPRRRPRRPTVVGSRGSLAARRRGWAVSSSRITRFRRPYCKATRIARMRRLNVWPHAPPEYHGLQSFDT